MKNGRRGKDEKIKLKTKRVKNGVPKRSESSWKRKS